MLLVIANQRLTTVKFVLRYSLNHESITTMATIDHSSWRPNEKVDEFEARLSPSSQPQVISASIKSNEEDSLDKKEQGEGKRNKQM